VQPIQMRDVVLDDIGDMRRMSVSLDKAVVGSRGHRNTVRLAGSRRGECMVTRLHPGRHAGQSSYCIT
jgi:hypothetical protein